MSILNRLFQQGMWFFGGAGAFSGYKWAGIEYLQSIEHWKELNLNHFLISESDEQRHKEYNAIEKHKILKSLAFRDGKFEEGEWAFLVMLLINDKNVSAHRKMHELSRMTIFEKSRADNLVFNKNISRLFNSHQDKLNFVRQLHALAEIDGDFCKVEQEFILKIIKTLKIDKDEINIE